MHCTAIDGCVLDDNTRARACWLLIQSFDTRMLMMNVISRFVGAHKLFLLNFYPYLQKYMQPHQKNVTHILVYLAQVHAQHVC